MEWVNWVIGIGSIAALIGIFLTIGKMLEQLKRLNDMHPIPGGCVGVQLQNEFHDFSAKMEIIWSDYTRSTADHIREATQSRRDFLADKLVRNSVSEDEAHELYTSLKEYVQESTASESKKQSAQWLLAMTNAKLHELETIRKRAAGKVLIER